MSLVTPVDVSLCTTATALMAPAAIGGQLLLDDGRIDAVAPVAGDEVDLQARAAPPCRARASAKWPVSNISTVSPGDSVLTNAASHAPVPDEG